jgi:hypothetical protein
VHHMNIPRSCLSSKCTSTSALTQFIHARRQEPKFLCFLEPNKGGILHSQKPASHVRPNLPSACSAGAFNLSGVFLAELLPYLLPNIPLRVCLAHCTVKCPTPSKSKHNDLSTRLDLLSQSFRSRLTITLYLRHCLLSCSLCPDSGSN